MPPKGDPRHGVERGAIVEHDRESSHAENGIIDLDLAYNLLPMLLPQSCELCIGSILLYFL